MDHLAVGVQGAMNANFLALELLYLVLGVEIVGGVAGGILQHILVTRFHDRTGKDLNSGLLLLCWLLTGLLGWILLLRGWRGALPEELSAHKHHPTHEKKHGKKPRRV